MSPNFWIETAPSSVATLGRWNSKLLIAMGCAGRGFSSHRSGIVTRTCIKNILENHGNKLSKPTVEAVLQWGG